MNRLERLRAESGSPAEFARGYLEYLRAVIARIDLGEIACLIQTLLAARDRSARIFFFGNGGSAATASHFANDIAIGSRSWARPFRAISLTDNVPVLTAIANDYGYDEIFLKQLEVLMSPGDVVVAISVSGNSPNVLRAVEYAQAHGATTVALTGFDGGKLRPLAQLGVHVPTTRGEYGPAEDVHMILDHLVSACLMSPGSEEGDET